MLFYFTATGNSLSVAKEIEAQPVSIAQAIHDEDKVYWADSIGIVCPVFGHGMLELVKEFLKGSQFETDYFYILLTYATGERQNWQRNMRMVWASIRPMSM